MVNCSEISKTKAQEARKNARILDNMWRPVNTRVSERQDTAHGQGLLQRLSLHIAVSLKADRRRLVDTEGGNIEVLLKSDPSLHKEA